MSSTSESELWGCHVCEYRGGVRTELAKLAKVLAMQNHTFVNFYSQTHRDSVSLSLPQSLWSVGFSTEPVAIYAKLVPNEPKVTYADNEFGK